MKTDKNFINLLVALFCAAIILGMLQDHFSR